ncbi:MAG TPA: alpha/beta family hydrolase [Longimicrobiales bacterium]|nr:alpha/beta family hydrolase [Longimicrobiales bacterium]
MTGAGREQRIGRAGVGPLASVSIEAAGVRLVGDLAGAAGAAGLVVFVHGSGSSRTSPRNRYVAGVLQEGGLATLLFDLLTPTEERIDVRTRRFRFDIELLAARLEGVTDWILSRPDTARLRLGYFGASTGAAAALIAAARRPEVVHAIVSRGGRPDLAGAALADVRAPTLLIVGGRDHTVVDLNREAAQMMRAPHRIEIIEDATHLFEEPGALDRVAQLARDWFRAHLVEGVADRGAPGGADGPSSARGDIR